MVMYYIIVQQKVWTCWSSGVQMPHVIWLSRLISEDQCLCPLTEPTSTKPSRYAMSAWVPSCDQVKSLTWKKGMFTPKMLFLYTTRCNCYPYDPGFQVRAGIKRLPAPLCRSPTLRTICPHTGSTQKYLPPYHRWPASGRAHSNAPRQPAKAPKTITVPQKHSWRSAQKYSDKYAA